MQLTESGFEQYRCDSEQCLGIQFSALSKILKCMTSKDSLSIQAADDGDVVSFIFESPDQKRYSNFELKLNDIDQEQLGIPETEYETIIEMPSAEFQRICRDLAAIGDTVTISATKQGVQFAVDGDAEDNGVRIELEESVQQTFSLRYLNNFTKATGLSKEVVLRMGADVPLEVEYKIADFGSLRYYLAPKIDDDE